MKHGHLQCKLDWLKKTQFSGNLHGIEDNFLVGFHVKKSKRTDNILDFVHAIMKHETK